MWDGGVYLGVQATTGVFIVGIEVVSGPEQGGKRTMGDDGARSVRARTKTMS